MICGRERARKTEIAYKSNINFTKLSSYLNWLVAHGFLEIEGSFLRSHPLAFPCSPAWKRSSFRFFYSLNPLYPLNPLSMLVEQEDLYGNIGTLPMIEEISGK